MTEQLYTDFLLLESISGALFEGLPCYLCLSISTGEQY